MKRYKISIFGGGERSDVEMDLRPTESKVIERLEALFFARWKANGEAPHWMDVEEVAPSTPNN